MSELTSVLVSCGSNVDPERNLPLAFAELARRYEVAGASTVFVTVAVAERPMPEFLNAAVEVRTSAPLAEIKFGALREIEWMLGRRRTEDRNAPRPIDLDIAMAGDRVFESEPLGLTLPDPEILTRAHVAVPLADLAPKCRHPVTGESLAEIAERLTARSAIRVAEAGDLLRRLLAKSETES